MKMPTSAGPVPPRRASSWLISAPIAAELERRRPREGRGRIRKTASPPRLDPVKLQTATRGSASSAPAPRSTSRERRAAREQVAGARRRERAQDCLQKVDTGQRREGARLEHEGAARGDGRRDLEDGLEQRVVPGRHERGDARRVRRDGARGHATRRRSRARPAARAPLPVVAPSTTRPA